MRLYFFIFCTKNTITLNKKSVILYIHICIICITWSLSIYLVYTWLLSTRGAPMVGADVFFLKNWHPRLPENALRGLKSMAFNISEYL